MGIRHSLAQTAADLVAMVRTRVALFSLELNIETSRVFGLLALVCGALVCALLAVIFFSLLIVTHFWDTPDRMLAIGLLSGFYALSAVMLVLFVCKKLKADAPPFAATLQELERDVHMLTRLGQKKTSTGDEHDQPPSHKEVW